MICFKATSHLLAAVLLCIFFSERTCATSVPLKIDPKSLQSSTIDGTRLQHLQNIFHGAERYLGYLKKVLDNSPGISWETKQVVLEYSFGNLNPQQLNQLRSNVDQLLKTFIPTTISSGDSTNWAVYSMSQRDIAFTAKFFSLPPFCQSLVVIHEAVHVHFHASDWFKQVSNGANHLRWQPSTSPWPALEPAGTVVYSGYEHANMEYLIRTAGGDVSLFNPDSYASAAYRAAVTLEEPHLRPHESHDKEMLQKPYYEMACGKSIQLNSAVPHPVKGGHDWNIPFLY